MLRIILITYVHTYLYILCIFCKWHGQSCISPMLQNAGLGEIIGMLCTCFDICVHTSMFECLCYRVCLSVCVRKMTQGLNNACAIVFPTDTINALPCNSLNITLYHRITFSACNQLRRTDCRRIHNSITHIKLRLELYQHFLIAFETLSSFLTVGHTSSLLH